MATTRLREQAPTGGIPRPEIAFPAESGNLHSADYQGNFPDDQGEETYPLGDGSGGLSADGYAIDGRMDRNALLKRNLRELIKATGKSDRAVSLEAGLAESALRDIFNDKVKNPRRDTLAKLASHLGVTVSELMGESAPFSAHRMVPLVGELAPGVWRSGESFFPKDEWTEIPVANDPRFPGVPAVALLVKDRSFEPDLRKGSYALVLRYEDMGVKPRPADVVAVERRRGDLVEVVACRLEREHGKTMLRPIGEPSAHDRAALTADQLAGNVTVIGRIVMEVRLLGL